MVIVVAVVKEGVASVVPAAVGGIFTGDTPLGVGDGAVACAVVLTTGGADVYLRGAVYCLMTPALTAKAAEGFLFEFRRAHSFSCYGEAVSDCGIGTFCGVE